MKAITILVAKTGNLRAIHDDALTALYAQGATTIRRASYVEPTADGRWTANMVPATRYLKPDGPLPAQWVLGPFVKREEALQAERLWLVHYCGL